eukprot:CAMPEP_0196581742 /NCGR_PEP_ID=MMETSP1081-20130531/35294_1 /TAXON_ID=36882 /ORGANISM="Pyramimonas amylifera, Strain CCMP720" /LENGTH=247 /DNA_ID=CAMNT_0041902079 /DNA_START=163 /DNA_END=903 /DNA_ORIENTATION=+
MSFNDAYERNSEHFTSSTGSEECSDLEDSVFNMALILKKFKKMIDIIGTESDSFDFREKVKGERNALQLLARTNTTRIKKLNLEAASGYLNNSQTVISSKIVRDFHSVIKDFQLAQRVCIERESMYSLQGSAKSLGSKVVSKMPSETDSLLTSSNKNKNSLKVALQKTDDNSNFLRERAEGIAELQTQINEVNEIFQDLAVLVSEQGIVFDDIESNITRTSNKTRDASVQLKLAGISQKNNQTRICW